MKKNIFTLLLLFVGFASQAQEGTYTVVEEMPRFPGCETLDTTMEAKRICAEKELLTFIYTNIVYPDSARVKGTQGTVVIRFMINKDGKIEQSSILRDIGNGCGEESLRIVNLMNEKNITWIPGQHEGKAVNVWFNLPVRFKLEQEEEKGQNLFVHFVFCRDFTGEFFQKDFLTELASQDFDGTDICTEGINLKHIKVTYEQDDISTTVEGDGWTKEVRTIFNKADAGGVFNLEYTLASGDKELKVLKVLLVE